MVARNLQATGLGALLLLGSCSLGHSFERTYTRCGPTDAPTLHINGERVEPTKENSFRAYGVPTFTIEVADGEVCIWRDSVIRPFSDEGHTDWMMGFDKDGNFRPADLDAEYGFCRRCGADLRGKEVDPCPGYGRPCGSNRKSP